MWNNTDTPLAYLISFRTYGTWLHGDKRGSIDRHHKRYGSPYIAPNRNWRQYNQRQLRTNHVHAVVSAVSDPEAVLKAFKANGTRRLREERLCWLHDFSPWARKGSKPGLWNERSVANAIKYVLYEQGDDLPNFDE